ncbi:MAG TPA: pseudouridine synthase, partial [Trichococcus flocculiformis]|nr:pseudouridine synthase [Trichococcus flocculiformis]
VAFAQGMLRDHEAVNRQALDLVKKLNVTPEDIALDVIYEDDALLVVNKPSGMVVHPSKGHLSGTLVNGLLFHVNSLSDGTANIRPGIVHRIDMDTTGSLIVCKNDE